MKYLIAFAVDIAALLLLKRGQRQRERDIGTPRERGPEPMLPCRHCGVHVPASRCIWRDGEPYCSAEHADLG